MGHIRPQPQIAMTRSYHTPVLLTDAVELLAVQPGKKYIDGTVGGGGHAAEIIKRGGILLGIDTDREAIAFTRQRLGTNVTLVQGNFRDIEKIAKENGFNQVHGILLDLGVSSHQLDTRERGMSFRFADAPLDLRLSQGEGESAARLVNRVSEQELYEIFATFGEEERAGTIAHAVVRARTVRPIRTVGDLVMIIQSIGIIKKEESSILSRVFQALRIAVNDELKALEEGIGGAKRLLVAGGRLAIISFHSLEDRIVKRMMRAEGWQLVNKKPIVPTQEEIERNKRARSAKLRVAVRL